MTGPDFNPFSELANLIDKGAKKFGKRAEHRDATNHHIYATQKHFEALEMQRQHERDLQAGQHQHEASESAASRAHELERTRLNADVLGEHIDRVVGHASGGTPIRVSHGDTTIDFERKRRTGGRQRNPDKD